ncbi:hypothetical protein L1987_47848 [Smallanthus sonchifolius]|uniref:Uncharacterized protein n=1 Tax=Smallanthus sonchifolius TaxID=185202 RepID=A0ACB9FQV7_9ASTR|nr:hypothetical protein L1987_47848 [Smallanthus sonchifolius]
MSVSGQCSHILCKTILIDLISDERKRKKGFVCLSSSSKYLRSHSNLQLAFCDLIDFSSRYLDFKVFWVFELWAWCSSNLKHALGTSSLRDALLVILIRK